MIRSVLKSAASISLIVVACWNLRGYTTEVFRLPSRDVQDIVYWEKSWEPVHKHLNTIGYSIGDLGYVTARSLRGEPVTDGETTRRMELSYVVIPLNLVHNKLDAPFLLADFVNERPAQLPPGLIEFFDPGNGLVLLKNTNKP